jgi:phosphotriesterase-related protein
VKKNQVIGLLACVLAGLAVAAGPGAVAAQTVVIPDLAGRVLTVNGPIAPAALGYTLMREHVFVDLTTPEDQPDRWAAVGRTRPIGATAVHLYEAPLTMDILGAVMLGAPNRDNWRLDDERTAIAEVADFRRHGGGTIVEATSIGLGRNPVGLRRVADATGAHIVMGTGRHMPGWYPGNLADRSIESLTEEIVRDIVSGAEGTDVRAGIVGEVGTGAHPEAGVENRILRAAARASRLTGAALLLHAPGASRQHAKLIDIVAGEGADPARIILAHADEIADQISYLKALMDRGATLAFDRLGEPPLVTRVRPIDFEVARTIVQLIEAGYADRIVLSQGVNEKTRLKSYGGTGYAFIEESFLPWLRRQGVGDAAIEQISVRNPQRLLSFVAPGAQP